MDHIPKNDILQIGLNILQYIGERMRYKSSILNGYRIFNIAVLIFNLFFILANFARVGSDYGQYIKTTEGTFTICHVSIAFSINLTEF